LYGGGGVGGADSFESNLNRTNGAYGYAKVGWRTDPVSGHCVSLGGFPNLLIRKWTDVGGVSQRTLTVPGGGTAIIFDGTIRVTGVFEMNTYTGGTAKTGCAYLGGTPTYANRLKIKLTSIPLGTIWYLNHAASVSDGCVEASGSVVYTATGVPTSYTLEFILPADSKLWEPVDSNGVALPYLRYGYRHESQCCRVLVDHKISASSLRKYNLHTFVFSGFIPNVYDKGAEK
jgi:hypothetical protein